MIAGGVPVRLEEIHVRYPGADRAAIDGVSLSIEGGALVVLLGPSGCGKSTLLRTINGLVAPQSGRIAVRTGSRRGGELGQLLEGGLVGLFEADDDGGIEVGGVACEAKFVEGCGCGLAGRCLEATRIGVEPVEALFEGVYEGDGFDDAEPACVAKSDEDYLGLL